MNEEVELASQLWVEVYDGHVIRYFEVVGFEQGYVMVQNFTTRDGIHLGLHGPIRHIRLDRLRPMRGTRRGYRPWHGVKDGRLH